MNTNITPDVFASYTAAAIAKSGFRLGDEVAIPKIGHFILSEAQEDLSRGHIVKGRLRFSGTGFTPASTSDTNKAVDPVNAFKGPKLVVTNAGAVVAAGALAGLRIMIDDTNPGTDVMYECGIVGNTAGISGAQDFTIYLDTALAVEIGASCGIFVFDPDYVELSEVVLDPPNGIAPCAVDQSEAPYFWRQVDGYAQVITEADAPTYGKGLTCATTDGEALVQAAGEGPAEGFCIGTIVQTSTAAHTLALVKLNRLS